MRILKSVPFTIRNLTLHFTAKDIKYALELHSTTPDKLLKIRKSGQPTFVLKTVEGIFYTEIPNVLLTPADSSRLKKHLCSNCSRCSAAPDHDGGCEKVRNLSYDCYVREGHPRKEALEMSKRIEKYDFITLGYETFNVKTEDLSIAKCTNFSCLVNIPQKSLWEAHELRTNLAQFIYPDVETDNDVNKIIEKNYS